MGYYSDVMICTTKKGYERIVKNQEKVKDQYLFYDEENPRIEKYMENDKECVYIEWDYIKYYKEFEEIKQLEKTLSKLKDGYIFCRWGESVGDVEFRHRTNIKELEKPFDFIENIRKELNHEYQKRQEEEEEFE